MARRVFGPVPSRRLGISLGVNNIPYKVCTYSCRYCQVGKAVKMQANRQAFYSPDELLKEVSHTLNSLANTEEFPNYITVVPDGEPALDINLGKLIDMLKTTNVPVAVMTNASLIFLPDVQNDVSKADLVSLKIDTVTSSIWKKLNHPVKSLQFSSVLAGVKKFANEYKGKLVTETMLVKDYNDSESELYKVANYIRSVDPVIAYLAVPIRPPAFSYVLPPSHVTLIKAYHIFSDQIAQVELLAGYEGNAFSSTGTLKDDILAITAVHPMQEEALKEMLRKSQTEFGLVEALVNGGMLKRLNYLGNIYYTRNFKRNISDI